ncbi:MAG: hypothetical protein DI570_11695 [Phenylobacterium zucineum]|nr:MAG: hypothetical protein DI570_11695 [Phenylobacterium zucineum]
MSLQPGDPASEAFERLRLEVALLHRAVEGLAAGREEPAADYAPTLAALRKAVGEVEGAVEDLGERPILALTVEQLAGAQIQATSRILARPIAELERDRVALGHAIGALHAVQSAEGARAASWRRRFRLIAGGAAGGVLLWSLLLGPFVQALPAGWRVSEALAADLMGLTVAEAGGRLLETADPAGWAEVRLVRRLGAEEQAQLRDCLDARDRKNGAQRCTLKLRSG